jgi:hypothetical protein
LRFKDGYEAVENKDINDCYFNQNMCFVEITIINKRYGNENFTNQYFAIGFIRQPIIIVNIKI